MTGYLETLPFSGRDSEDDAMTWAVLMERGLRELKYRTYLKEEVSVPDTAGSNCEAAWAAGFMEGEGSFFIRSQRDLLCVAATQVDQEPLERLKSLYGGSICADRRLRDQKGSASIIARKPQWKWILTGDKAYEAGTEWVPYLSSRRRETLETALATWSLKKAEKREVSLAELVPARDAGDVCHVCGEVVTWVDHLPPSEPGGAVRCYRNVVPFPVMVDDIFPRVNR